MEWSKIKGLIGANAPRHVAARIFVSQVHFQQRGRTQAEKIAVTPRKILASLLVQSEGLLEFRSGDAIADPRGHCAQVQALRVCLGRAQKTLGGAVKVRRAREIRLRAGGPHFNAKDSVAEGNRREEFLLAREIEFRAAVKLKHQHKDTRGRASNERRARNWKNLQVA